MICSCRLAAASSAVALVAACSGQAPPAVVPETAAVELRLRMQAGDHIRLLMTSETATTMTMMGREQESSQTIASGISMFVESVDEDGSAMVRTTYDSVRLAADGPSGTIEYDSDNPPDPVPLMARAAAMLAGKTITMRLSPRGEASDVRGFENMGEELLEAMDLAGARMPQSTLDSLGEMFDDDSVSKMIQMVTGVLPDRPVRIGESWAQSVSLGQSYFSMNSDNTLTLRDRRDGVSIIDLHGVFASGPPTVRESGPLRLRYEMAGEQTGTLELDESTGWPIRSRVESTLDGTMTMEGMSGMPEGLSTPMSARTVMSIERREE